MTYLLLGLAGAALLYQVLSWICLAWFFRQGPPPLVAAPAPGVTIFKPLKGLEPDTRECLLSFLNQDYQPFQVLFGVADPQDPVVPLIRALLEEAPHLEAELVICPESLGHNPKISSLRQMEDRARYDLWVIADGDVRVAPDFLARVAGAFIDPGVGLVTCPYRAGQAHTVGAVLEALNFSADFIPSVAIAYYLEGIRFALGATMSLKRRTLQEIGGFKALADYLADDYQLGYRVAQAGYQVRLLPLVVETVNPKESFPEFLAHQLRWGRTLRVCRPKGYLAYGITHALVYSTLLGLATGFSPTALTLILAALAVRGGLAYFSAQICLKGSLAPRDFLLLPLKDFLSCGIWLASLRGNHITWRGKQFRITAAGKLEPV